VKQEESLLSSVENKSVDEELDAKVEDVLKA
jgi:hypothetical protein